LPNRSNVPVTGRINKFLTNRRAFRIYKVSINECGILVGLESLLTLSPEIEECYNINDLRYATLRTSWFYWLSSSTKSKRERFEETVGCSSKRSRMFSTTS
jgi:hypothetical protein